MSPKSPRTLIYDIETSLQPVAVFDLIGNDYINHDNILGNRHLISMCWKWFGEDRVYSVSLLDDPKRFAKDPHDDLHVVRVAHKVMSEADCIVAHFGDQFDKKYIDTRVLFHGLPALPPVTSVDTKKIASSRFKFNSNKLDFIGKFLGLGKKIKTDHQLWLDIMRGSKRAIREMVTYNKQDVILLEKVFLKLLPFVPNYISRELFGGTGCPRCGSHKIQSRGVHRAISRIYNRFQCQTCSGWFKSVVNDKKVSPRYRIL